MSESNNDTEESVDYLKEVISKIDEIDHDDINIVTDSKEKDEIGKWRKNVRNNLESRVDENIFEEAIAALKLLDEELEKVDSRYNEYIITTSEIDHSSEIMYSLSFLPLHLFSGNEVSYWNNQICDFILKNTQFLHEVLKTTDDLCSENSVKSQPFKPSLTENDLIKPLSKLRCKELVNSCLELLKYEYNRRSKYIEENEEFDEKYKITISNRNKKLYDKLMNNLSKNIPSKSEIEEEIMNNGDGNESNNNEIENKKNKNKNRSHFGFFSCMFCQNSEENERENKTKKMNEEMDDDDDDEEDEDDEEEGEGECEDDIEKKTERKDGNKNISNNKNKQHPKVIHYVYNSDCLYINDINYDTDSQISFLLNIMKKITTNSNSNNNNNENNENNHKQDQQQQQQIENDISVLNDSLPHRAVSLITTYKNLFFIDPVVIQICYLLLLSDGFIDHISTPCDAILEDIYNETDIAKILTSSFYKYINELKSRLDSLLRKEVKKLIINQHKKYIKTIYDDIIEGLEYSMHYLYLLPRQYAAIIFKELMNIFELIWKIKNKVLTNNNSNNNNNNNEVTPVQRWIQQSTLYTDIRIHYHNIWKKTNINIVLDDIYNEEEQEIFKICISNETSVDVKLSPMNFIIKKKVYNNSNNSNFYYYSGGRRSSDLIILNEEEEPKIKEENGNNNNDDDDSDENDNYFGYKIESIKYNSGNYNYNMKVGDIILSYGTNNANILLTKQTIKSLETLFIQSYSPISIILLVKKDNNTNTNVNNNNNNNNNSSRYIPLSLFSLGCITHELLYSMESMVTFDETRIFDKFFPNEDVFYNLSSWCYISEYRKDIEYIIKYSYYFHDGYNPFISFLLTEIQGFLHKYGNELKINDVFIKLYNIFCYNYIYGTNYRIKNIYMNEIIKNESFLTISKNERHSLSVANQIKWLIIYSFNTFVSFFVESSVDKIFLFCNYLISDIVLSYVNEIVLIGNEILRSEKFNDIYKPKLTIEDKENKEKNGENNENDDDEEEENKEIYKYFIILNNLHVCRHHINDLFEFIITELNDTSESKIDNIVVPDELPHDNDEMWDRQLFGINGDECHFSQDFEVLSIEIAEINLNNNKENNSSSNKLLSNYLFEFLIGDSYEDISKGIYTKHSSFYPVNLPPFNWGIMERDTKKICIVVRVIESETMNMIFENNFTIDMSKFKDEINVKGKINSESNKEFELSLNLKLKYSYIKLAEKSDRIINNSINSLLLNYIKEYEVKVINPIIRLYENNKIENLECLIKLIFDNFKLIKVILYPQMFRRHILKFVEVLVMNLFTKILLHCKYNKFMKNEYSVDQIKEFLRFYNFIEQYVVDLDDHFKESRQNTYLHDLINSLINNSKFHKSCYTECKSESEIIEVIKKKINKK